MANDINLEMACNQIFGITSREYRTFVKEQGAPEVIQGKVDFVKVSKWLIEYYRGLAKGQGSLSLTDEKIRLTKISADREELLLKKEKGELINSIEAMRLWSRVCQGIRSKILSIPTELSPIVLGVRTIPEIKNIIEKFVREVLTEIANPDLMQISGMASNKGDIKHIKSSATSRRKK